MWVECARAHISHRSNGSGCLATLQNLPCANNKNQPYLPFPGISLQRQTWKGFGNEWPTYKCLRHWWHTNALRWIFLPLFPRPKIQYFSNFPQTFPQCQRRRTYVPDSLRNVPQNSMPSTDCSFTDSYFTIKTHPNNYFGVLLLL